MKKYITTIIFLLLSYYTLVHGQISTHEKPESFKKNIPNLINNERTQKRLPSLDMKKIEQEDNEDEANGMPPRFGIRQKVDYNLDNSGEWDTLSNGDRIWRLSISCPEALSINILYDKFWIPDNTKFFIYSNDHKYSIGAITSKNNKGDKNNPQGFATGLVYGDEITLEYYLPSEVEDTGIISIAYVVHGYKYINVIEGQMVESQYGGSGNCQVNVNCSEGQNWQSEKNAVAMIIMDGSYICTGSLINTTTNDNRLLFLTANHCLVNGKDAINAPNLSQWTFYWQYESQECTNTSPSTIYSTVGATVVANNAVSDFALLRLTENPLNATGVTPYYLGWDRTGNSGIGGVGIHHPSGDIKKIATYSGTPVNSSCMNNYFWQTGFIQTPNGYSVMEPGSSGSPLINSNHKVIGQLYGPGTYMPPHYSPLFLISRTKFVGKTSEIICFPQQMFVSY